MGKNADDDVEGAEPGLPTIKEEEVTPEAEERTLHKSKSILKPSISSDTRSRSRSITVTVDIVPQIQEHVPESEDEQIKENTGDMVEMDVDIVVEDKGKEQKKKGKKGKAEKGDAGEAEVQEGKPKKGKKPKGEDNEGETKEKTKKGKGKSKEKSEVVSNEAEVVDEVAQTEPIKEKKEKKEKKGKKEKGEAQTEEAKDETKGKEKKGKKDKKDLKEGEGDDISGFDASSKHRSKDKMLKKRASSAEMRSKESLKRRGSVRAVQSHESDESDLSERSLKEQPRRKTKSFTKERKSFPRRSSAISYDSSIGTTEQIVEELSKQKKEKKDKKQKKKKEKEEKAEETEEEKERKKAQKEEELKAKKEAKKAAKQEADAKKRAEKGQNYDDLRKRLEELNKQAYGTGVGDVAVTATEGEQQGPKKKPSKKEKAKMTADMAEKAKVEMEAQIKRLEEILKKQKEEERLAAIERDKRDSVEQGMRIEQLQETGALIKEIVDYNADILREQKDLLEWNKYIECGKLPNPTICDQMNTYLHLWELDLQNTSIEGASERTSNAIKLLSELDDHIDTVTPEEIETKLENWKWIRQLFREYQSESLDVATYRLMRDVEHNLNRINIPTADFNFKDEYVTLCLWLRVMLPIPLPNPRRPPKPRVDINFQEMDVSVLFPLIIDCDCAAIRAMYLKYDHLSDLSETFHRPNVPPEYCMELLELSKKEWRTQLKYKFDNRDKPTKRILEQEQHPEQQQSDSPRISAMQSPETMQKTEEAEKHDEEKNKKLEGEGDEGSGDEIPLVPFKQLNPTASDYVLSIEDQLYSDTREKLRVQITENVINLRKYVILGGVYHLNLLAQPPQPQDFVTMEMTITGLSLPKKLEVLPFKVVYTPYIPPPDPEPTGSDTSVRKLPEQLEEEIKKQEEELDKLILISIKWPQHVIFLELPIVCRWDDENKQWSNEEIEDVKHNEDKCMLSFRTGVFGIYGLASYRYSNLPFQAYDIKPEVDDSVTVQLTAAILMIEFNIKNGLIAITQLQNSPNMTLQETVGKYMRLYKLRRMMKEAGIDIFPAFDAFCYVDGCCEKQWAMEKHLYHNMAQIYNCFNFSWSRWNIQAGRRKIVLQMRHYEPDKNKQKNHQMLLVTPLKATFIECTEVSQSFSEKEVESLKFCADLYHLMKVTNGIFVRNKVSKAPKENVYTLAQLLISIRVLSFS